MWTGHLLFYILSVQSMKPCCHNNTSYQWSPDSSQWLLGVLNKHCYYTVVTLLVKFHLIFSPKKVTEEISFTPELLVLKFSPSINVHETQIFKYFPSKNLLNWFFQFSFKLNLMIWWCFICIYYWNLGSVLFELSLFSSSWKYIWKSTSCFHANQSLLVLTDIEIKCWWLQLHPVFFFFL